MAVVLGVAKAVVIPATAVARAVAHVVAHTPVLIPVEVLARATV